MIVLLHRSPEDAFTKSAETKNSLMLQDMRRDLSSSCSVKVRVSPIISVLRG